jgi:hypothetical protein
MRVVIQQVDMDTCLTALVQGISGDEDVIVVKGDASPADLADPGVLCIEAGGSGQVELKNFDHHNTTAPLPPACRQAFQASGRSDPLVARLVDYVAAIDVAGLHALPPLPGAGFPTLSDVFAGMRLVIKDPVEQLRAGLALFKTVLTQSIDPFGLMPELPDWQAYLAAKRQNDKAIEHAKANAEIFTSTHGLQVGYLETDVFGIPGALYALGCPVAIAFSPRFGDPPAPKYTIGGNGVRVDHLLPWLNALESGWGGPAHGTIIGSPRTGSRLMPGEVKRIVCEYL